MYQCQIDVVVDVFCFEVFYFEWVYWDMCSCLEGFVFKEYMCDFYDFFVRFGYDVVGGEVWDSMDWVGWCNCIGFVFEVFFLLVIGDVCFCLEFW